jgi:hypothetical protein
MREVSKRAITKKLHSSKLPLREASILLHCLLCSLIIIADGGYDMVELKSEKSLNNE